MRKGEFREELRESYSSPSCTHTPSWQPVERGRSTRQHGGADDSLSSPSAF